MNSKPSISQLIPLIAGVLHIIFAALIIYYNRLDYFISADCGWNWFWQHIPIKHLQNNLISSVWYLHSQPPLHNLYFGILIKLFYPHQLLVLQIISIVLGGIMISMLFYIIQYFIKLQVLRGAAALIIFFNPAILLYGNYLMYTFNSAFLVISAVFLLVYYINNRSNNAPLYLFALNINLLILYRSSFHIIFLFVSLIYLFIFITKNKKHLMICLLISILSVGWCLKNYALYGFFGTSSWFGLNIYKFITTDVSRKQRLKIRDTLNLPAVVKNNNHFYTEDIEIYRSYGYNKLSDIPSLNENNFHNINIPDISRIHGESGFKIIKLLPLHYIRNSITAFTIFNRPSFNYPHLESNKKKIPMFIKLYNNICFADNYILKKMFKLDYYPASMLLFVISVIILIKFTLKNVFQRWQQLSNNRDRNAALVFLLILIIYYSAVSCLFEIGENDRFRFSIEPFIYIVIAIVVEKFCNRRYNNLQLKL